MGRIPHRKKHEKAMLYLPSKLLDELKLRKIKTKESVSSFVARVLMIELNIEDKYSAVGKFARWFNNYSKRKRYDFDDKLHHEVLEEVTRFGIMKDPDEWTKGQHDAFNDLFHWRNKYHGDITIEGMVSLPQVNEKAFRKYYETAWEVDE